MAAVSALPAIVRRRIDGTHPIDEWGLDPDLIEAVSPVVGPGAVTPLKAARMGGRIPVPALGPGWWAARAVCELTGAPLPAHVIELLTRGRGADGALGQEVLHLDPVRSTESVLRDLYEWADIVHLDVTHRKAA